MNLDQDQKQDASKPDIDYFLMPLKPRQMRNIHSVKTQRNPQTVNIQAADARSVNSQSANDRAEHETNTHGTSEKPAYDTPPVLKRNRKLPLLAAGLVCTALIFGIILMVRSSGSSANNSISSVSPVSVSGNTDTVSSNDEGSSEKTETSVLICGENIERNTDVLSLSAKEISDADMASITENLPYIRRLNIIDSVMTGSLSDLGAIKSLDHLSIYNTEVSDFSDISACSQITSLNLGKITLSAPDLDALSELTQLRKLKLSDVELPSDCSALENLSNLTSLNIGWTALTDTSSYNQVFFVENPRFLR
ncbi:MAG: hypothetical protein Q4B15_08275, partial [Lachnospiraceae bacterium]|nr:hypothetical protein [Lachnospiraceae bacterium]